MTITWTGLAKNQNWFDAQNWLDSTGIQRVPNENDQIEVGKKALIILQGKIEVSKGFSLTIRHGATIDFQLSGSEKFGGEPLLNVSDPDQVPLIVNEGVINITVAAGPSARPQFFLRLENNGDVNLTNGRVLFSVPVDKYPLPIRCSGKFIGDDKSEFDFTGPYLFSRESKISIGTISLNDYSSFGGPCTFEGSAEVESLKIKTGSAKFITNCGSKLTVVAEAALSGICLNLN